jgi:hypothetical protein
VGVEVVLVDRREGEVAACDIRVVTLKGMRFSKGSKCRRNGGERRSGVWYMRCAFAERRR